MNRLAADAIVFDRVIASSTSPGDVLAGYLRDSASGTSVAAAAAAAGVATVMFTDSHEAMRLAADAGFEQCVRVEGLPDDAESRTGESLAGASVAGEIEDTHFAKLLAAALAHLETLEGAPVLLWIHSSALAHLWDAPHPLRTADEHEELEESRELYSEFEEYGGEELGEFDAESDAEVDAARRSALPPNVRLSDDADPDLLLAWMAAYGGQIRAVDALLDVLLDTLVEGSDADLVLASTSGFALGEQGWIGPEAGPPCSPRIHLPVMIRRRGAAPLRSLHPALSDRLAATLIEMVSGAEPTGGESLLRDAVPERWASPPNPLAPVLRTVAPADWTLSTTFGWFYCRDANGEEHLYLKPDDRNDANDIADLKPEVLQIFQPADESQNE